MYIYRSPERGVSAIIKKAPGFIGEDIKPGKIVISQINPLVDGGYTGVFKMPGDLKPVKVKIIIMSGDTLVIMTWDRRANGKIMKWKRTR